MGLGVCLFFLLQPICHYFFTSFLLFILESGFRVRNSLSACFFFLFFHVPETMFIFSPPFADRFDPGGFEVLTPIWEGSLFCYMHMRACAASMGALGLNIGALFFFGISLCIPFALHHHGLGRGMPRDDTN